MTKHHTHTSQGKIPMAVGMRVKLVRGGTDDARRVSWAAGKVPVGETGTLHKAPETNQWHVVWDNPTAIIHTSDATRDMHFGLLGNALPSWLEVRV